MQAEIEKLSMDEHKLDDQIRLCVVYSLVRVVAFTVRNLFSNADASKILQRNAGKIEVFE